MAAICPGVTLLYRPSIDVLLAEEDDGYQEMVAVPIDDPQRGGLSGDQIEGLTSAK